MRGLDLASIASLLVTAFEVLALAFIPLVGQGRLLGKFMSYYPAPHRFSQPERDFAIAIARQLGFGIERTRAREVRRAAIAELGA